MNNIGYEVYKRFLNQILDRMISHFGEDVILSFALFGSVARGEARPDSDKVYTNGLIIDD